MAAESSAVSVTAARLSQHPPPLRSLPKILLPGLCCVGVAEAELSKESCWGKDGRDWGTVGLERLKEKPQRTVMGPGLHGVTRDSANLSPKILRLFAWPNNLRCQGKYKSAGVV